MYLNSFSVRIEGGKERESGYVELPHGRQYAITLRNDRGVPCDAEVVIDGKPVGEFRINAHGSIRVERPVNEQKRFTFYRVDTDEAVQSDQDSVHRSDKGLVQVTFKPGMPVFRPPLRTGVIGQRERGLPRQHVDNFYYGEYDCLGMPGGLAESLVGEDLEIEKSTGRSFASRGAVPLMGGVQPASMERRAGVTGLSGDSSQRFYETSNLSEYDSEHITTITMRLVAVLEERRDPTPLRPVAKSTPIPPPVWII